MTLTEFINKSKEVHGDLYKYLDLCKTSASIECKAHGVFKQNIYKHLKGRRCQKCGKEKVLERVSSSKIVEEEFVNKLINKFNNIVLDGNYIDYNTKTWFKCSEHGNFNKTPKQALISGCNKCSKISSSGCTKLDRENNFIRKAIEKYGNYYDYSKVKYINMHTHIEITCKKHGSFFQTPANHLKHGCKKCGIERIVEFSTDNTIGWSYTNWGNASNRSKNFESFKVYILKFENDDEIFYKVGKTFRKTKFRIKELRVSNYNIEILSEFVFDTAKECSEYEQKLKNDNKINSYKPHIKFDGYTECFIKLDKWKN